MTVIGASHRTPQCVCLACGCIIDAATAVDANAKPSSGDFTLCLKCGHIMVFTRRLRLRNATASEYKLAVADQRVMKVLQAVGALRGRQ